MDVEEDFPRTTEVVLTPLGQPRRRREPVSQPESFVLPSSTSNSSRPSKVGNAVSPGQLPKVDNIEAGTLLLGTVAMVTSSGLRVHLPGGMQGFARATDVVDLPTGDHQRLHHIVASAFSVGSHVVASVLEVKNGFLALSMKPSVINKGLRADSIIPGMLLPSCLRSYEEHGAIISFTMGDNELRGFVKHDYHNKEDGDVTDKSTADEPNVCSTLKKGKQQQGMYSTKYLMPYSTVYVVVESVNLDRKVANCKWAWESDIPVAVDCSLPLLCVRPGLLLVGQITEVHYPAAGHSSVAGSRVNYGFDIKCLSTLSAVVPALHSVTSYSVERLDAAKRDKDVTNNHTSSNDKTSHYMDPKGKSKAEDILDRDNTDHPLEVEDTVIGRVIYVDHWQKTIYVSLLSHIVDWKGPKGFPNSLLSSAAKTFAKVIRSIPGNGVIFSLCRLKKLESPASEPDPETLNFSSKLLGYCPQSQLSDDARSDTTKGKKSSSFKIAMSFTLGSVHPTVELEYDFFMRVTQLTMRQTLSKETLVSPFQLHGGTLVKAEITKIAKNGLNVRISKFVHGKVTMEHLTDVPLPQVPDRYKVGATLKLRVLRFDHVHNMLLLTAKRAMRKDSDALTSFEQLSVGKEVVGYISRVKRDEDNATDRGETVFVKFYNDLQTTLDQSELREAKENEVELNNGDVVRVVVTRIDKRRGAFYVTLTPEKMSTLKSMAKAKQKRKREIRREACKKAFTNYVSSRKRKASE